MAAAHLSVVVPYFEQQRQLDLLLLALAQQVGAPSFEVVVADDGSAVAPRLLGGLDFACRVVRQPDLGFRAAAARNLGAAVATGTVLVFLDADTLPTAGYLATIAETVAATDAGHGVLVVGRRRHFDGDNASQNDVLALLRGEDLPARLRDLGEPEWLAAGHRRTADLRDSADEDFRLVISAVLAVDRHLWTATEGFDESFVGYGGEDWDFAWRAWLAGADRRHEPRALAWHDGPDAAGRAPEAEAKNAESLRLASSIPLPSTRGRGLVHTVPAIAVRYLGPTTGTARDAPVVVTVADWLTDADAAVWFPGCGSTADLPPLLRDDPRVHPGDVPKAVADRAIHRVDVHRPLRLPEPSTRFCARGDRRIDGWLQVQHTRHHSRRDEVPAVSAAEADLHPIDADLSLERRWGGW